MPDTRTDLDQLRAGSRLRSFQDLGRYRVHDILLVSTLYDSFILAEDGQLSEVMLSEFLDLDLHHTPRLTRVSSGSKALAMARDESRYNLIISSMQVGDMSVDQLAQRVGSAGLSTPVIGLAYDARDLDRFATAANPAGVNRAFLWQGDARVLLAIVKYVEDRMNVARDTGERGVQAILVIEDSVPFYSTFLPVIYTELMRQSQSLLPEGMNRSHKLMRIQARPKILLCGTFEEAWSYFEAYQHDILGIISDVEFPKDGELCAGAGVEFARRVRERQPDVPIMLQSGSDSPGHPVMAESVGATFVLKDSPTLLNQLHQFMLDGFGFGDFVFRTPDGTVVSVARNLKQLEDQLRTAPPESVAFHAERNHFSRWLKARTEFELAHYLRPRKVEDFGVESLREVLVEAIHEYRWQRHRGIVTDFSRERFDPATSFSRIGQGSLGGKGRGLAFVNFMLSEYDLSSRFEGVQVSVPPTLVLATGVFDEFLDTNNLGDFAIACCDDAELAARFRAARFPERIERQLAAFLEVADYPLAVRSSSLLEDSPYQPFAGIYETVMIANDGRDAGERLAELTDAIRAVYISMFRQQSKTFLDSSPYRLEGEKMAVILQKVTGKVRGDRFYPDIAGVARSHNFYPLPPMKAEDGIAAVALGLGAAVVEGEACVRFCPRYPKHLLQFSNVDEALRDSQRDFYALELHATHGVGAESARFELQKFDLAVAEQDGALALVGSTYSPENDALYDGIGRPGVRLVSFAPILKHARFPLAEMLRLLLQVGERATGGPVEIEFAINVAGASDQSSEFAFLQLRPMALSRELTELDIGAVDRDRVICQSDVVLGHGHFDDLHDLVVVDANRLDRGQTLQVAAQVAKLNAQLTAAGTPYILIGPGRWGSADSLLGIPVRWEQIAGARVIVESGFDDFKVTPSQGTHIFQNITATGVGYFTVNPAIGDGAIDWEWLGRAPALFEQGCVRHLRFAAPLVVKMNGRKGEGVVYKP